MKIKKLYITAFGPYAKRQEIDFEEKLENKRIFLITGNTGAGKTTIFDAINFALYGEASGSDREGKFLRSDYASPDTKTEVELHFSVRNRNFILKRSPQYFRKKQRGDGFTESKATAELIIESYIDNEQKVITGTKEVTRQIEEILGITSEQFKQLVMIPQGEFKKLLNSDSDKKEEIFRKIFGTKIFSDTQEKIKIEANSLKRNVEDIQKQRLALLKSFILKEEVQDIKNLLEKDINIEEILEKFNFYIVKDEEELSSLKENILKIKSDIDLKSKELFLAEENNKLLYKFKEYEKELENLDLLKEEYKEKNSKLQLGKKALSISILEENYKEKINEEVRIDTNIKKSQSKIIFLKEDKIKAKDILEKEEKREEEKIRLNNELNEIASLKEKVKIYEVQKKDFDSIKKLKELKEREIENTNFNIEKSILSKTNIEEELKRIVEYKNQKNEVLILENNTLIKIEKLNKLKDEIENYNKLSQRHKKGSGIYEKEDEKYKKAKEEFDILDDEYRRNQAGLLASNLRLGEACPVCGSKEHPSKANLNNKNKVIKEDDIKLAKDTVEVLYSNREKYFKALTEIKSNMDSIIEKIILPLVKEIFNLDENLDLNIVLDKVSNIYEEEVINLNNIREKLDALNKEIDKEDKLNSNKQKIDLNIENLRKNIDILNKELIELSENLKGKETTINNIKEEFKGNVITLDELVLKEIEIKNIIKIINDSYEKAKNEFNIIDSKLNQEKGIYKTLEERRIENKQEIINLKNIFENKLKEIALTYEEYQNSKISEELIKSLEIEVDNFKLNYSRVSGLYKEGKKQVEGKSLLDLEVIKNEINNSEILEKEIKNVEMEVYSRLSQNKNIINECINLNKLIKKDEDKYRVIGKLAKIINGDNKKKMSFERYVLAAYFEDIIIAANQRLSKMTNNRFSLLRKEEVGDKRKGQGLDLEVYDVHTSTTRDVKSLSGGESFKASLSLALGLADVVQAYSGGIQLDTMFIDEGFGSLDPESLDNAIECLISLQDDGRLVGIISHVEELKTRIESKIIIESSNQGSNITFSK